MNYIRTKDGVYKFKSENICKKDNELFEIQEFFEPIHHINYKLLGQIQKQADTIEELCDRFIFINKKYQEERNRYIVYTRLFEKKNLPKYIQNGTEIYGAIFTDKGLIYVAKMNENGDLKLI